MPDPPTYAALMERLPPELRPHFDYVRMRPLCLVVILGPHVEHGDHANFWALEKHVRDVYVNHGAWLRAAGFVPSLEALKLAYGWSEVFTRSLRPNDLNGLPQYGATKVQVRTLASTSRYADYWWKIPPAALEKWTAARVCKRLRRQYIRGIHT